MNRGVYYLCLSLCLLTTFTNTTYAQADFEAELKNAPKPPYIYDKEGRIVVYHGITVSYSARHSENFLPWHTMEDFAKLKEWGFNLVRYFIFWEAIEPSSGIYNDEYMEETLKRFQWLNELGIDVLVCVHQDLYSRKFGGSGFPNWAMKEKDIPFAPVTPAFKNYFSQAVMACFDDFWRSDFLKNSYIEMLKYVISKIQTQPNVIGIEVFDEPWPHIGPGFEQTFLTEFYQKIDKMKQENGFHLPMYFQPMLMASVVLPSGLKFEPKGKAVYAVRYLDPLYERGTFGYGRTNQWIMTNTITQRVREAMNWGLPMLVTDFGVNLEMQDAIQYLNDWWNLMMKHQIGWVYSSYDKDTDNPSGILDKEGNTKPILSKLVQVYPQRIAGRNPLWFIRGNLFRLTYETEGFTNTPTVVFVPRSIVARQIAANGKPIPYNPLKSLTFEYTATPEEKNVTIVVQW